jgi:tRNA(Ile)-lysidine synthetase-like protein
MSCAAPDFLKEKIWGIFYILNKKYGTNKAVKYVLAVSGGVDSVVMLDMLAKEAEHEIIVAHFDHGIREDSVADAEFVRELAKKYDLVFAGERVELGAGASEEKARKARYEFLWRVAKKYDAQLLTAHHKDDVIETIVINLLRGTGWRGLCSLRDEAIKRPLLHMLKEEIIEYAAKHHLQWRTDSTNDDVKYLRNYVRRHITSRFESQEKDRFFALYEAQLLLHTHITQETSKHLAVFSTEAKHEYRRYPFIMMDSRVGRELLYAAILQATGKTLTRPQLGSALQAIKTFRGGARYEAGEGVELIFSKANVIVDIALN